jgi:hypothetical protein
VIFHKNGNHLLLEIMCVCLQVVHSWRKENVGVLFLLIWRMGFASCVVLIFVLHDVLWDRGSDWWIGLQKDDELLL